MIRDAEKQFARTCAREVYLDGNTATPTRYTQELISGMEIFLRHREGRGNSTAQWLRNMAGKKGYLDDHGLSVFIQELTDSFKEVKDRTNLRTRLTQGFIRYYIYISNADRK